MDTWLAVRFVIRTIWALLLYFWTPLRLTGDSAVEPAIELSGALSMRLQSHTGSHMDRENGVSCRPLDGSGWRTVQVIRVVDAMPRGPPFAP